MAVRHNIISICNGILIYFNIFSIIYRMRQERSQFSRSYRVPAKIEMVHEKCCGFHKIHCNLYNVKCANSKRVFRHLGVQQLEN